MLRLFCGLAGILCVWGRATAAPPPVRLQCNQTLKAGSTLALTDKLDLSGRQPDQPQSIQGPCGIYGPIGDEAATILVPANDCVLLAQGEVTITGNIRFVVGTKIRQFDCCDDGEGHGGILCSYSNLTIAENARVSIQTTDDTVVLNPGAFWTGKSIHVHGTVNASLKNGQITGLNGILSSTAVHITSNGHIVGSGMDTIRGAAIQGGDGGTIIEGTVECKNFTSGDSGGCVAAGNNLTFASSGIIRASNGYNVGGGGVVLNGGKLADFQGTLVANNISSTQDAGAIFTGDAITMSNTGSIIATNVYAGGGPSVIASEQIIVKDFAKIVVNGSWGGDAGAIGGTLLTMKGDAKVRCENAVAAGAGGCIGSSIVMSERASIIARNVSSQTLGGALAGGYPKQYLVVGGNATIDIDRSSCGIYGGGLFFWENMTFGNGAFHVQIKNTAAPCGSAMASLGPEGLPGDGNVFFDDSDGGQLVVENAKELNASKGCIAIQANLLSGTPTKRGPIIPQPCGKGCSVGNLPTSCQCSSKKGSFVECCSKS